MSCSDLVTAVRQSIMSVCGEAFWASIRLIVYLCLWGRARICWSSLIAKPPARQAFFGISLPIARPSETTVYTHQQATTATICNFNINLGGNRLSSATATSFSEVFIITKQKPLQKLMVRLGYGYFLCKSRQSTA